MLGLDIVGGIKQNRDPFSIARAENNGGDIFLSGRKLLEQVQQKARKNFSNSLTVGTVLMGTVTRLMPYRAFVELIPGVDGMGAHFGTELVANRESRRGRQVRGYGSKSVNQLLIGTLVVGGKI